MFKMSTFCHSMLPTTTLNSVIYHLDCSKWNNIFERAKFIEHWISRYLSHENIAWMTSLGIVQKPGWLYPHSRYQLNFSFFLTDLSTHLAPFHLLQTCLGFLLLLPLLVVVNQIQPSIVVELQQYSPLSNNHLRSSNDKFTVMFVSTHEERWTCFSAFPVLSGSRITKIVFPSHFVAEK